MGAQSLFFPLNTIKGNSMKVAVDNIILKPSKFDALELQKDIRI